MQGSIYTVPFQNLKASDLKQVGGKNASLGEMISSLTAKGIVVPVGFATTADAFYEFIAAHGLEKKSIVCYIR